MKLCNCGCGSSVKKKGSSFCPGHNSRGRKLTDAHKDRIGQSNSKAKIAKECLVCGKSFSVKAYRENSALYCSRSCRSKGCLDKAISGGFQAKGKQAWNKGIPLNYVPEKAFKKGQQPWNKGTKKTVSINVRISAAISCAVRRMAKGKKNSRRWQNIVGWGLVEFKTHMERLFKEGMCWGNHGSVWHIDHIIPIVAFNITSLECLDFKRCWSLDNLQPLFVKENLQKSGKLFSPFQPGLGL